MIFNIISAGNDSIRQRSQRNNGLCFSICNFFTLIFHNSDFKQIKEKLKALLILVYIICMKVQYMSQCKEEKVSRHIKSKIQLPQKWSNNFVWHFFFLRQHANHTFSHTFQWATSFITIYNFFFNFCLSSSSPIVLVHLILWCPLMYTTCIYACALSHTHPTPSPSPERLFEGKMPSRILNLLWHYSINANSHQIKTEEKVDSKTHPSESSPPAQ